MSPRVECTEFKGSGSSGQSESLITIQLNDPAAFDPEEFDQLVQGSISPQFGSYSLHYIVCGGTMYLFSDSRYHDDVVESLRRVSGVTGKLQSAGRVVLIGSPRGYSRTIEDYSRTLEDTAVLSREDSDAYKNTVIREKLGGFFEVT